MVQPLFTILGGAGAIAATLAASKIYELYDPTKKIYEKIRTESQDFREVGLPLTKFGVIVHAKDDDIWKDEGNLFTRDNAINKLIQLGYNNLFVLSGNSHSRTLNTDYLPSDKDVFFEVLSRLESKVTQQDSYFLLVIGPGARRIPFFPLGEAGFFLNEKVVTEGELEERLDSINPMYGITLNLNCFSGRFARRLGKKNRISISTSRGDKIYYSIKKRYNGDSFLDNLLGYLIINNNASLEDAFDYASRCDDLDNNKRGKTLRLFPKNNTPHLVYGNINPKEIRI